MTNSLRELSVRLSRLTPTEAEIVLSLTCALPHATTEIRGRLMGPNCQHSTTIEIAHPVHALPRSSDQPHLRRAHIVIPEPAWWDCESPFLYHGPIELWEHEHKIDEVRLRIGLRHAEWKGETLHWNGRPIELRSEAVAEIDDGLLHSLRERQVNSVVVPADLARTVWPIADRAGILVMTDGLVEVNGLMHPSAVPARPH